MSVCKERVYVIDTAPFILRNGQKNKLFQVKDDHGIFLTCSVCVCVCLSYLDSAIIAEA